MSSSDGQPPDAVTPEMVVAEHNLIANIRNALGLSDDFDADDSMRAAMVYNTARAIQLQRDMIAALSGQDINFSPDIDLDIDAQVIRQGVRQALSSENRLRLYSVDTNSSTDNVLTQPLRPSTANSAFRVTVVLDTGTGFSIRINPDNEAAFTADLNQGSALTANAMREFTFDTDENAQYNFRTGAAATVELLEVQEVLTE